MSSQAAIQDNRRRFLIGMLGAVALALAALIVALAFLWPREAQAYIGVELDPPKETLPFTLQDQDGNAVQWSDYRGKPVVLTFVYTSCREICPLVAHKLSRAYDLLGERAQEVAFLAITVDPERDTPEAVQAFSQKWNMAGRWDYLTGSPEQLNPLWQDYWVGEIRQSAIGDQEDPARPSEGAYSVGHTSPVHVIDPQGKGRLAYGMTFTPEDLAHDVRLLLSNLDT